MNQNNPALFYVNREYLKYMHEVDSRVSLKYNGRMFAGIVTIINEQKYVIPLTSQTTEERKKRGKGKRSSVITTFVAESSGKEIADLLYNNMLPVYDEVISPVNIDPKINTYELNEIRFLRKSWDNIQKKAVNVYKDRNNKNSPNYGFLLKVCCDYRKLEEASIEYLSHSAKE
jgi:hypothetical protein